MDNAENKLEQLYPWKPLPKRLKKKITCKKCGEPMRLIRVNDNIVFWVHRGKQLLKCSDYAFKTAFIPFMVGLMQQKEQHLKKQMVYNGEGQLVAHDAKP